MNGCAIVDMPWKVSWQEYFIPFIELDITNIFTFVNFANLSFDSFALTCNVNAKSCSSSAFLFLRNEMF